MQNKDSGELLLGFSTEESSFIEKTTEILLNENFQYKEKYVVDGIGYFVLTDFESCGFCHIDVYILNKQDHYKHLILFLKEVINKIDTKLQGNKTKDELLLAKYFNGEYSKFEINNKTIIHLYYEKMREEEAVKMTCINYSIGIDTTSYSKDDIINLGFWLTKTLNNLFNEVIQLNMSIDEFILYFYNLVINQLDFLKRYYEEMILNMDDKKLHQQIYFFTNKDSENKSTTNEELPF